MEPELVKELAARVKRGARLLDKKVPNWRTTMRKHADTFRLNSPRLCILGTLEHYNGRMKVLKARGADLSDMQLGGYYMALRRLHLDENTTSKALAFNFSSFGMCETFPSLQEPQGRTAAWDVLQGLWEVEFAR